MHDERDQARWFGNGRLRPKIRLRLPFRRLDICQGAKKFVTKHTQARIHTSTHKPSKFPTD